MRTENYPEYVRVVTHPNGQVSIQDEDNHQVTLYHNAEAAHSWLGQHSYLRLEYGRGIDGWYRRPRSAA